MRIQPVLTVHIIESMAQLGIPAEATCTGGNCWAVLIRDLHGEERILITDGDAGLPRYTLADGGGVWVGRYADDGSMESEKWLPKASLADVIFTASRMLVGLVP